MQAVMAVRVAVACLGLLLATASGKNHLKPDFVANARAACYTLSPEVVFAELVRLTKEEGFRLVRTESPFLEGWRERDGGSERVAAELVTEGSCHRVRLSVSSHDLDGAPRDATGVADKLYLELHRRLRVIMRDPEVLPAQPAP